MHEQLRQEFEEAFRLVEKAESSKDEEALQQANICKNKLKIQFLQFTCFTIQDVSDAATLDRAFEELKVVRDVLELSVLIALARMDADAFVRECEELQNIYFHPIMTARGSVSERQTMLVGCILLWHLSHNNLEDFHLLLRKLYGTRGETEGTCFCGVAMSKLTARDVELLQFPLKLERDIMDGNMSKVLSGVSSGLPDPHFAWCLKPLVGTLRRRVAAALECAYRKVSFDDAMRLLAFRNKEELLAFIERRQLRQLDKVFASDQADRFPASAEWIDQGPPPQPIERPGTPSTPIGGGATAATLHTATSLSRTSSTGATFSLQAAKRVEREFAATAPQEDGHSGATTGDGKQRLLLDPALVKLHSMTDIRWDVHGDQILFKPVARPRALIPAYDLMNRWLGYAVDLEAVV